MLELSARVPFGPATDPAQCAPWPTPVSAFNFQWLKGTFVPSQRDRLTKVTDAITAANAQIEKVRAQAVTPIEVGQRQANGNVVRTADDALAERSLRTHAQRQTVNAIVEIRKTLDPTVPPILRDMARASLTADTLRQRVFDKLSVLARASLTGLDRAGWAHLKANYAAMLRDLAPIELFAAAQRCIDDGSAESLPLLDSIRLENFRRPKDSRAFLNAALVTLANVPEFNDAQPLLGEVQAANQTALLMWAQFHDHSVHARVLKMSSGLANLGQPVRSGHPALGDE